MAYVVDRVVVCDAFREPERHYQLLAGGTSRLTEGRRPSMRLLASAKDVKGGIAGVVGKEAGLFDDLSASAAERNDFVNQLREEARAWREAGWPGTAVVTRRLLEWWFDRNEERRAVGKRFFFRQQEAVETVIYLYEVQNRRRMPETGNLLRYALELATGTGKTVVMALFATWATLHKREVSGSSLSANFLVLVPNLTVRDRVSGQPRGDGLEPSGEHNLYDDFEMMPPEYREEFRSADLRRFQWTGIVAEGRRCHTNEVPCHTDLEKRFAEILDGANDVVRYFKNERLGFSVTYYESNRPRQYCPDLIIVSRERNGREVLWLAETKGEIRPNTALKCEAARLWCERMSATRYGQWRYLFVQQRKLDAAPAAGVGSLAELADALVRGPAEPQFRLIALEDERVKREAFKTLLPLYSLKSAAGCFGSGEAVEPEAWIGADGVGRLDERMFVRRAAGRSMEPTIRDGDYVVFRAKPAGTRQGKIVLAQYRGPADPDTGGAFTVKRYSSEKVADEEGGRRHTKATLSPINPSYPPIVLSARDAEAVQVLADFVTVLRGA